MINRKYNGIVGLKNIGNSCFMNSSIQCMSNLNILSIYFLEGFYKKDINQKNKSEYKGKIATNFAKLIKSIFDNQKEIKVINPSFFKETIASFYSIYKDSCQKDAVEFLIYLINGLHDDLNKYIPKDGSNKIQTPTKAKNPEQHWVDFINKNQSIITEIYFGMYKSSLKCLICNYKSESFEPYTVLDLPIPRIGNSKICECYVIFYDMKITPISFDIPINNYSTIGEIRTKISKILKMNSSSFTFASIINNREMNCILDDEVILSQIDTMYIYCFQKNPLVNKETNIVNNQLMQTLNKRKEEIKQIYSSNFPLEQNTSISTDWIEVVLFIKTYYNSNEIVSSFPRIFYINKKWSNNTLYIELMSYFSIFLSKNKDRDNILFNQMLSNYFNTHYNVPFTYETHLKYPFPFIVKLHPVINSKTHTCVFCSLPNCEGCLLPYEYEINDLLQCCSDNSSSGEVNQMYFHTPKNARNFPLEDIVLDIIWRDDYKEQLYTLENISNFNPYKEITLNDCFLKYLEIEELFNDNKWLCEKCKKRQDAMKSIELTRVPIYLIISLKRFALNQKDDTYVKFPIKNFEIEPFIGNVKGKGKNKENYVFNLKGVINHVGQLQNGHYYAFCKKDNNRWFMFNDSEVVEIGENSVVSQNAYVIFYERDGLDSGNMGEFRKMYEKNYCFYKYD